MRLPDAITDRPRETEWRWERIGWALLVVIVLAEMAGAFGGGVLARTEAVAHEGDARYEVQYQRFNRYTAVTSAYVSVEAPRTIGDTLNVTFSQSIATGWRFHTSTPPAASSTAGPPGATFRYTIDDWSGRIVIGYSYAPREIGIWDGNVTFRAGTNDPVSVPVAQRIYP